MTAIKSFPGHEDMKSVEEKSFKNKKFPQHAPFARKLEKWAGMPFNFLEIIGGYLIVRPLNWTLRHLDVLSYKLEGTLLREILAHTIFPVTLVLLLIAGFEIAESGFTLQSAGLLAMIPVSRFLIFGSLERLMPFSRNWLEGGNDMSVDIMMFISTISWGLFARYLLQVLFIVSFVEMLEPYGHNLWPSSLPGVVQVFLFILIKDFFRYWYHRALHEVPFLWRFHAAHHSVKRLYWLNGTRSHPLEGIGQVFLFALPFALLQPSAEIALVAVLMQFGIGVFQHHNMDLKLRFWEYIFSIGDNHRYHHYPDKKIGDSNYGGEFIVWDILFGTFHNPKNDRPHDRIGIGTAPNYPMTMAGLYIAPFLPDQKVFGPEQDAEPDS